jgi:hypothetical protein
MGPAVAELFHVRERWAQAANSALEQAHVAARIDHRTLRAQGIDREPLPHIPRAAFEMERHGYRSVVAERLREQYQARVDARLPRSAQAAAVVEPKNPEEIRRQAIENWLRYREAQARSPAQAEPQLDEPNHRSRKKDHSL